MASTSKNSDMTVHALSARLRDVLSDEVFMLAGERSSHAYGAERRRGALTEVAERAHKDAYRDTLVDAVLPLLLSLQEEQRREIRDRLLVIQGRVQSVTTCANRASGPPCSLCDAQLFSINEGLARLASLARVSAAERPVCQTHGDPLICLACEADEDRVWAVRGYVTSRTPTRSAAERPAQTCEWTEDEDGVWHTGCGEAWQFTADGPIENRQRYCGYCGKFLSATTRSVVAPET